MTRTVNIGNVTIGGGNPVAVQSMTNTRTSDVEKTVAQIGALAQAGCQIVRVAVLDETDASSIRAIRDRISIPLVADIHFDYRLAIACMENGADKIRFNPGNIGSDTNVKKVVDAAKLHKVPIRVGVNGGSVGKEILEKYGNTAEALAESALEHVRLLEKFGFYDTVVSVKSSSVVKTVQAYRIVAEKTDCPLHVGVTEAGTYEAALVKSAAGIGGLLALGIGDTIRVSVTGDPVREIYAAKQILRAVGLDRNYAEVVSCPTCGRCRIPLESIAEQVRAHVADVAVPLKVAVMGCVVNGVGEGKDADVGLAGGVDSGVIFRRGEVLKTVPAEDMVSELLKQIDLLLESGV